MRRARHVYDEVRETQQQLGTGQVEEALKRAEPLREEASDLLGRGERLTSFDRTYAAAAYTYATIVLILALAEGRPPLEAIPAIRRLTTEALAGARPGMETWKVLTAASEMLARAGDAEGAVWAVRKAGQIRADEDYVKQLAGSIRSMYPQVFAEAPDPAPDEPPPLQRKRR